MLERLFSLWSPSVKPPLERHVMLSACPLTHVLQHDELTDACAEPSDLVPGPTGGGSLMKMLIGAAVGAGVVLAAWAVRELLGLRWRRRARAAWETAQAAARRDKSAASPALRPRRAACMH
jgi:hypothetical protein